MQRTAVASLLSMEVTVLPVGRTADELAPAYLIMVAASVSFFAAWGIKETYRMPLAGRVSPISFGHI